MKLTNLVIAVTIIGVVTCSIYPEGETKEEWDARINSNIDKVRKNDVTVKIPLPPELRGRNFRLQVNQTRQSIPLGTALAHWHIAQCFREQNDDPYCAFASDNFNFGVAENGMKWPEMEPTQGNVQHQDNDDMLSWAAQRAWGFRGHCLFWDRPDPIFFPDWIWNMRGQELIDAAYNRIQTAMPHYQGRLLHWDVNNEMLHGNWWVENTYDPDIRVKMFQWAKERDSGPLLFVNDYNAVLWEADQYINLVQGLQSQGAPVEGLGCQGHFDSDPIDLGRAEANMDKYWDTLHLPIWVTEFDWNGNNGGDHSMHAEELDNFYRLMMSKPGVEGILMWGFWDQQHWRPDAAITNGDDVIPNAAGIAYQNLYHNFLQTHITIEPTPNESGDMVEFSFRAFRGEYDVTLMDDLGRVIARHDALFEVKDDMAFLCNDCV